MTLMFSIIQMLIPGPFRAILEANQKKGQCPTENHRIGREPLDLYKKAKSWIQQCMR